MKKLLFSFLLFSSVHLSAQQWETLSSGIRGGVLHTVYTLTQYDSNLVAGGWFDSAGGVFAGNIAQWNNVKWDTIGSSVLPNIQAECIYNNNLIIAGEYGASFAMLQWDRVTWSNIQTQGYIMEVFDFATYKGNLYACGVVGESINSTSNIAIWNGNNWDTLSSGVIKKNGNPYISAMVVYNGNLYAGGSFDTAGNVPAKNIAMWNGTTWSAVGDGFNSTVSSLYVSNGTLYAAGSFDSSGTQKINCVSSWDGSKWNPLGLGIRHGGVNTLIQYSSLLCAAGSFDSAGGQQANNIAFWDGTNWSALGSGITGNFGTTVRALSLYNGALIAAGSFSTAGGISANNIAQWISPLGMKEIAIKNITVNVYPNPCNGKFSLASSSRNKVCNVEIYSVLGQQVYQATTSSNNMLINLSNQPNGIYLYRVITKTGDLVGEGKVIIGH